MFKFFISDQHTGHLNFRMARSQTLHAPDPGRIGHAEGKIVTAPEKRENLMLTGIALADYTPQFDLLFFIVNISVKFLERGVVLNGKGKVELV